MRRQAFRRLLVAVLVLAASTACGATSPVAPLPAPSATTPPPPSLPGALPGIWTGFLHVATCVVGYPCGSIQTVPFTARVATEGAGFIGSLEIPARNLVLDIHGVPQADGSVAFTGVRAPIPDDAANIELRQLVVRADPATGLSGDIDVGWFYSGNGLNTHLRGAVASAAYQALTPTFSGSWSGKSIIRSCSGYCPGYQNEGDGIPFQLVVSDAGGVITAQALVRDRFDSSGWLTLTGTRIGSELALSGARIEVAGGESRHLENFSASLDALGRMKGLFAYAADDRIAVSPFNITYRVECELLWLTRAP